MVILTEPMLTGLSLFKEQHQKPHHFRLGLCSQSHNCDCFHKVVSSLYAFYFSVLEKGSARHGLRSSLSPALEQKRKPQGPPQPGFQGTCNWGNPIFWYERKIYGLAVFSKDVQGVSNECG